jgi:acyl-coenzyme A thioesterase PaaI-like protein
VATTIFDLLSPEIMSNSEGSAELRFTVRSEFTIPGGNVQGGIVSAMLDMAMAMAAGGAISTASLQLEIHRPVKGPVLEVTGEVTRKGQRLVFCEAEMRGGSYSAKQRCATRMELYSRALVRRPSRSMHRSAARHELDCLHQSEGPEHVPTVLHRFQRHGNRRSRFGMRAGRRAFRCQI